MLREVCFRSLEFGPDASGSKLEFKQFVHSWRKLPTSIFQLPTYQPFLV
jgi:hypothetical protein